MTEKENHSAAGCIFLSGIILATIGGCFVWGPGTLVVTGVVLIVLVIINKE